MKKHIRQLYVHTLGGNTISTRNDNIKETYKLYFKGRLFGWLWDIVSMAVYIEE